MPPRQSRGRQRIPIQPIQNPDDRYATFSKRRLGLYKKASELSTLCGADIGIIIFSPTDNPFAFFSPSMESVVERYQNPNRHDTGDVIDAHSRGRIEELNQRLDELLETKEQLKEHEVQLNQIDQSRPKGWWEQVPLENLSIEQVDDWTNWFQNLHARANNRIEELTNGGANAPAFQEHWWQNVPNLPNQPNFGPRTSRFPPTYDAPGPSSYMAPPMHGMPSGLNQFQSLYYNMGSSQGQHQSIGTGTSQAISSYYNLPEPSSQPQLQITNFNYHAPGSSVTQVIDSSISSGNNNLFPNHRSMGSSPFAQVAGPSEFGGGTNLFPSYPTFPGPSTSLHDPSLDYGFESYINFSDSFQSQNFPVRDSSFGLPFDYFPHVQNQQDSATHGDEDGGGDPGASHGGI